MDQNICHIDQGNVCHYYADIDGQCDKFEDETTKGLTNMQASTNLDEIYLSSCIVTSVIPMAFNLHIVVLMTLKAPMTKIS